MEITGIKTRVVNPPKDNIYSVIDEYCPILRNGDIFVITSKIVSIHQGRCIENNKIKKEILIKKEAEKYIESEKKILKHIILTIKNNVIMPAAGIDESNANGYYILLPKDPFKEAEMIYKYLKKKFSIKKLGVIITDSHSMPLRYGVTGISIGFYGFEPLIDYVGKNDIFNRKMKCEKTNIVDSLAVSAVAVMGESNERRPMSIIRGADMVNFINKRKDNEFYVPLKDDIYYQILKIFKSNNKNRTK